MTASGRAGALLLCALLLGAACGEGDENDRAGGDRAGGGTGGDGVDTEFEDDGGATLSTELDLGGPFAEDPSATGQLGPMAVSISSLRNPIETPSVFIDLTNPGGATLTGVSLTAGLELGGGTPPATEQPLVLSAQSGEGDCSLADASPQSATVSCAFGDVAAGGTVGVDLVITSLPKLSIALSLEAGGG
ncbi:MAG: hypothetical protein ACRDK3_04375 [Actinomycetota bacterium]